MIDKIFAVHSVAEIAPLTLQIVLKSDWPLEDLHCGQFLHLKINSDALLLRRPFCIADYTKDTITLIVAVVGKGTKIIAELNKGDKVTAIYPIGNGFNLEPQHKKIVLLGGGVGVAPLLSVPKCYGEREFYAYLGYQDKAHVILEKEFRQVSRVTLCTDDGSAGEKGYPTDVLERDILVLKPDVILTCGNTAMLKAVARLTLKYGIKAYMSGEARMGCGVGACLVCTCGVKQPDGSIHNKRACVDGPVFDLKDVIL